MTGCFTNIRISAVSASVPSAVVRNEVFIARQGDETVRKFEKMAGVLERRHCKSATTRILACDAAVGLRESGAWTPEDVDACLFVSQTPDYRLPATACALQAELGLRRDCVAFDVSLGCSGFVYGIYVASCLLKSGGCRRVLLTGGDCISSIVRPGDCANLMLFGDAGFAAVLERDEGEDQGIPYLFGTNGAGCSAIHSLGGGIAKSICGKDISDGFLNMDGPEVFNFTISSIPQAITDFCSSSGQELSSFDHFAFHQANRFILKQIAMLAGFPFAKHLLSIDRYGNTSSASIPLTLCANRANAAGKTMMCGFGVGLSWGVLSYDFSATKILDVRVVDD